MIQAGSPVGARVSLFRSLLKGTALYSLAMFSYRIASLILLPVNTRYLTPSDYAVLDLLEQIVTITSILLGLNVSASLGYFYFEQTTIERRNQVASTTMIGASLMGLIVGLVGCIAARPIGLLVYNRPGYTLYLIMMFLSLPLAFAMEAELSWVRVIDEPKIFAGMAFLRVGINIAGTVLLLAVFHFGILGVVSSNLIAAIVTALALTVYCFRRISPAVDFKLLMRMVRFSIPISLSSIAMFIIHFGDRFILPHYRPLSDLGIYGIAYKIGMLLSMLAGSFNTYWSAQVFALAQRDDANEVVARVFTYLLLFVSACSLALIVFARPAIELFTTPRYHYAAVIAPLIIIAYYFRSLAEFFRMFFIVRGKPQYESVCNWIGAAVCLGGYFVLIPRYGIWGAGIATALTFLVIGVISVIWTYRLKPYDFEVGRIVKITAAFVGVLVVYALVPVTPGAQLPTAAKAAVEIAWASFLMVVFGGCLWVLRVASPGEIAHARDILRQARGRIRAIAGAQS